MRLDLYAETLSAVAQVVCQGGPPRDKIQAIEAILRTLAHNLKSDTPIPSFLAEVVSA